MLKRVLISIVVMSLILMACSPENDEHGSDSGSKKTFATGVEENEQGFALARGVRWNKFDKGLDQAKEKNKYTFVKVYASWCGYCRKFQKQVLTDPDVQAELDKNFVSVLVDGESDNMVKAMGKEVPEKILAKAFGVTGYPTLLFLDKDEKVIKKVPGYASKKDFLQMLTYISSEAYKKDLKTAEDSANSAPKVSDKDFKTTSNGFAVAKGVSWKKYDDGVEEAIKDKKYTFVKFYASWCGYCRKMQKEVLTDPKVQAELDKNFVSILVDGEADTKIMANGEEVTEKALASAHEVTGFPTLVFLEDGKKVIGKVPGFIPRDNFYNMLTYISSESYKNMKFQEYLDKKTS